MTIFVVIKILKIHIKITLYFSSIVFRCDILIKFLGGMMIDKLLCTVF